LPRPTTDTFPPGGPGRADGQSLTSHSALSTDADYPALCAYTAGTSTEAET